MPVGRTNRRTFIAALGGAAAWPLVADAQQGKVWRVGSLYPSSATEVYTALLDAFRVKFEELGYVEGKNLSLDVRRADDDYKRLPAIAAALVSLAPNVIVGITPAAIAALQHATSSIPIIMAFSGDPVAFGFVKSLAKPGGNITGLSNLSIDIAAKSLELLHAAVPRAQRIAVLTSPNNPSHEVMLKEVYAAADRLGLKIIQVMAREPADSDEAFALHKENCEALFVIADPRTTQKIVELADQWRLPAIYQISGFVEMGGLLSYSANYTEQIQQAAIYVDKILKGANPADLPVQQPTKFELEINLKTAKALGLTIPDSILARADKVIE
jgi:putative ABC transport system substrate-binding protein